MCVTTSVERDVRILPSFAIEFLGRKYSLNYLVDLLATRITCFNLHSLVGKLQLFDQRLLNDTRRLSLQPISVVKIQRRVTQSR